MSTPSTWKKFRYRLEWITVGAMARLVPALPRKGVLLLAKGLGTIGYLFDKRGRQTAIANLHCVFGDEKPPEEIKRIAIASYRSFARTVCDQFWTTRLTRDNWTNYCRYEVENTSAIDDARESGGIWVTPHYGNFEWISLCAGFLDLPFCVIAQEFQNPLLTEFFKRNREHSGHSVIPQRRSAIRLLKHLKNRGHAAFLTDLTIPPGKAATVIDCMGLKTCVTSLHGELAKRSRLPVIPGISIPQPDGTYVMRGFAPLAISPSSSTREIAQSCWDVFEPLIREYPEHWLWMYKHWRFRPETDGDRYPPYANRSKKFDRLLERITAEEEETDTK